MKHASHISEQILQDFSNGNYDALGLIFDEYRSRLKWYSYQFTKDLVLAEDVISEVFIKLWQRRETLKFDSIQLLKSCLYLCVHNASINLKQKADREQGKLQRLAENSTEVDLDENALLSIIKTEVVAELHKNISNLPPKCQKIYRLKVSLGYNTHEIAKAMNISPSTVRNHYAYGLMLLKRMSSSITS